MVCLLTTVVVCLLVTAGCVTCLDDFDFTCPDPWKNGTVHTLACIIPSNKLNSPTPCDTYIDTVEFRIIKGSTDTLACTVTNINTACNNNNINEDTCGCQSNNGTDITIVYKIKAVRNLHENAQWACRPQCYDVNGNIAIQARNTSACFQTRFEQITTTTSPSTSESVQTTSSTSSPGKNTTDTGDLSTSEEVGIGVGVTTGGLASAGAVTAIVVYATMIFVYFTLPDDSQKLDTLKKKIKDMKGVSIRSTTPKEQENYKGSNYVIKISKLSKDQKQIRTELTALIKELGGQISSDELQAIEDAAEELRHTSKPSTCFGFGCIAGSPDPPNEPPADYNADSGR